MKVGPPTPRRGRFNVWVELFKSKRDGSVNARAKVEWGTKSRG